MTNLDGEMPAAGDNAKEFLRLLTLHDRQTFAYILLLVPNFNDAEEIAQEVRVKLWQQFGDRFERGTDFGAWARSVAFYEVRAFRRSARRQPIGFSQELLESLGQEFQPAEEELSERRAALDECLSRLSAPVREMLRRHYAGESWEQISQRMNRSTAGLRKAVYRARRTLADCIARTMRREA